MKCGVLQEPSSTHGRATCLIMDVLLCFLLARTTLRSHLCSCPLPLGMTSSYEGVVHSHISRGECGFKVVCCSSFSCTFQSLPTFLASLQSHGIAD